MKHSCAPLLLLAAVGCADNAILEMELVLPEASGDVRYAYVQTRSGEVDFEDAWSGSGEVDGLELGQDVIVSIEADDSEEIGEPLAIKLRYCTTERCTAPADEPAQEVRVAIERAFYRGAFTRIRLADLPPVTACAETCEVQRRDIERCAVRGCRAGDTTRYCDSEDRHFCEQ